MPPCATRGIIEKQNIGKCAANVDAEPEERLRLSHTESVQSSLKDHCNISHDSFLPVDASCHYNGAVRRDLDTLEYATNDEFPESVMGELQFFFP